LAQRLLIDIFKSIYVKIRLIKLPKSLLLNYANESKLSDSRYCKSLIMREELCDTFGLSIILTKYHLKITTYTFVSIILPDF